jgi:hypothetical protein
MLKVGKIYRLTFPGIAARVIKGPPGLAPEGYPHLVESPIMRSRWDANDKGEPFYPDCPRVVVPR